MSLSTFNSDKRAVSLAKRVMFGTLLIFVAYWILLKTLNVSAAYAETNLNAGLIRLQDLRDKDGDISVVAGTSYMAKLQDEIIFEGTGTNSVNMGIDGGQVLYAVWKIVESKRHPRLLIVEANHINVKTFVMSKKFVMSTNMGVLDEETRSLHYKMSEYIPVLRREYRPISVFYTGLKRFKDSMTSGVKLSGMRVNKMHVERPGVDISFDDEAVKASEWSRLIEKLLISGTKIIVVMIPDGESERINEYAMSRKIASEHHLPFIDLKSQLASVPLSYSDGQHLTHDSARFVSEVLRDIIHEHGLL